MVMHRNTDESSSEFWRSDCEERGPGLHHAHWADCDPSTGPHPTMTEYHTWAQCCHCGHTAMTWFLERAAADVVPEDDRPLVLPQPDGPCHHTAVEKVPGIADGGLEWATCGVCGMFKEPKLATGTFDGPGWGIGRGWVSPRTRLKWSAIAHRAMRDREDNLKPFTPSAWASGIV